jgi:hypothetical protein
MRSVRSIIYFGRARLRYPAGAPPRELRAGAGSDKALTSSTSRIRVGNFSPAGDQDAKRTRQDAGWGAI